MNVSVLLLAAQEGAARPLDGADTAWLLVATALVLLMTPALGFFYGGLVRRKNVLNTMMMSLGSLGAVGLTWALLAFSLAFFSLAQEVRVSATSYDIGRLQQERDRLEARAQELTSDLSRLGREPAVRKLALDGGLGQLGDPLILPAR